MTKKVCAFNLSEEAAAKIDRVAGALDQNRSVTLERLIMSIAENSMLRHARRLPTYENKGDLINGDCGTISVKGTNS